MRQLNRRGIELALNFLVILILSLVVLVLGISFVYRLVAINSDQQYIVEQSIREELINMATSGKQVSVIGYSLTNSEVVRGGKSGSFGIGISNINPQKTHFKILVECEKFFPLGTQDELPCGNSAVLMYERDEFELQNNVYKDTKLVAALNKKAKRGSYELVVSVCSSETSGFDCSDATIYSDPRRVFVTVP
jgi:hypothetical protein